jgi:hypothetical protein
MTSRRPRNVSRRAITARYLVSAFFVVPLGISLVSGCSGDNGARYGNLEPEADVSSFNLDDVQADWWPKDSDPAIQGPTPVVDGDEHDPHALGGNARRFFAVRKYDDHDTTELFTRKIQLKAGEQYQGYIYFRNSSKERENPSTTDGTSASVSFPSYVSGRKAVEARLLSQNAQMIGSSVVLSSPPGTWIDLQITSAEVRMRGGDVTYPISKEDLQTQRGAAIGCDHPDGHIRTDDGCWGQVLFRFTTLKDGFTLTGRAGYGDYGKLFNYIAANRNVDTFRVAFEYRNTGDVNQHNLQLGGATADGLTIDRNSYTLRRGDNYISDLVLDNDGNTKIDEIKPGDTIALSFDVVRMDWSKLCQNGFVTVTAQAWPDNFNKLQVPVNFYPDSGQC